MFDIMSVAREIVKGKKDDLVWKVNRSREGERTKKRKASEVGEKVFLVFRDKEANEEKGGEAIKR